MFFGIFNTFLQCWYVFYIADPKWEGIREFLEELWRWWVSRWASLRLSNSKNYKKAYEKIDTWNNTKINGVLIFVLTFCVFFC